MDRSKPKILVFLIVLIVLIAMYLFNKKFEDQDTTNQTLSIHPQSTNVQEEHVVKHDAKEITESQSLQDLARETIPIHIMGEVKQPGVYYMNEGDIVEEVIQRAGGLTDLADLFYINLAESITSNQKIYIPSKEEVNQSFEQYKDLIVQTTSSSSQEKIMININKAGEEELLQLNGIGPSKAAAIIQYRNEYGEFSNIEDLMLVPGIKENSFEKIKDQITIR